MTGRCQATRACAYTGAQHISATFSAPPEEARRIARGTWPLSYSFLSLTENLHGDHAKLHRGRLGESDHVHLFTQQTLIFVPLMNESWWVVNKPEMQIEDLGLVQTLESHRRLLRW